MLLTNHWPHRRVMDIYDLRNVFRISFKRLLKEENQPYRVRMKNNDDDQEFSRCLVATTTITTIDFTLPSTPSEENDVTLDENDISTLSKTEVTSSEPVTTTTTNDDVFIESPSEQPKSQRRRSVKSRNNSSTQSHESSTPSATKSPTSSNKKRT